MSFQVSTAFVQHYSSTVMLLLQQSESRFEAAVQVRPFYGKAASVVEQFENWQGRAVALVSYIKHVGRHTWPEKGFKEPARLPYIEEYLAEA